MATLSEQQIESLWRLIRRQGIDDLPLAEDLLDHLCCQIETHLDQGMAYDQALDQALYLLAPNGLAELQDLKSFLFTLNPLYAMKKAFYLATFAATFLISNGLLFRHLHWPGTAGLLLSGFLILLIAVLPLSGMMAFRQPSQLSSAEKWRVGLGLVAGAFVAVGMCFKVMHWPGANLSFLVGMVVLNLGFLPLFFYQLYQRSRLAWT